MTVTTNIQYKLLFNSSTKVVDTAGELSAEDTIQQQTQYCSNALEDAGSKRIELFLLPTPYATPLSTRVYDVNLELLQTGFVRILHIKSDHPFLYSYADSTANLNAANRTLAKSFVLDKGTMISPSIFTPDQPYPKYIRLINPLEINGGGTGNDPDDEPILASIFLLCTPPTI